MEAVGGEKKPVKRSPMSSLVDHLVSNELQVLESDKEGSFVAMPEALFGHKAMAAVEKTFKKRQLVCLGRSLLRGSKVLLLDEATSQMDEDTDLLIQMALREAFAQCTVLAVAHRVHTVLDYDR
ncbi:hypothetical protein HPB48_006185 [Haemaphysalis longicornis]|uniref:ABC transporter domain-containing protein n=1 Tax=Haemaphysalis longicornis TaxID=44386 RepID=A0A9J6F9U8_HAELO|nr:hypothetical protein HPB48_006185 [Haemaphysalis longicornis]